MNCATTNQAQRKDAPMRGRALANRRDWCMLRGVDWWRAPLSHKKESLYESEPESCKCCKLLLGLGGGGRRCFGADILRGSGIFRSQPHRGDFCSAAVETDVGTLTAGPE